VRDQRIVMPGIERRRDRRDPGVEAKPSMMRCSSSTDLMTSVD